MASVKEVAELAGVSVGTVSRYLNGYKLKAANMDRIAAAIKQLDYKQNIIAKGLKNNRSFSIGLLMNSISSRFGAEVVSGIEQLFEVQGYSLILSGFNGDAQQVDQKLDYLMSRSIDGLIVFLTGEEWNSIEKLADLKIPIVFINRPNNLQNADAIVVNDRESVKQAIQRIIELGHKKIGMITPQQADYSAKERYGGAKEAVLGLTDVDLKIYEGDYSRFSGYQGAKELIQEGITALFVSNYTMSIGALEYLNVAGIRIGKDIFFGHYDYDDQIKNEEIPMLIIQPPTKAMGLKCAEILLEHLNNNTTTTGQTIVMKNQIDCFN